MSAASSNRAAAASSPAACSSSGRPVGSPRRGQRRRGEGRRRPPRARPRSARTAASGPARGERGARSAGAVRGELAVQVLQRERASVPCARRLAPPDSQDHLAAPSPGGSVSRQPTPHTLTTSRCSPGRYSFWRSRAAWLSTVRDRDAHGYPHTPRSSSCPREHPRRLRGQAAQQLVLLRGQLHRAPSIHTSRAARSIRSAPIRTTRPLAIRLVRRSSARTRARSSV